MRFWEGKRVLVTGCSGLIGGYMCKSLLKEGAVLTGFDRELSGTLPWHNIWDTFTITQGDITDLDWLKRAMNGQDIVFHLAARSHVEESRQHGYDTIMSNTLGTLNVLEAARQPGIKAVVVASSNHVYGLEYGVAREESGLHQLDTYSVSKICADYLTRAYWHNYQVPTVAVRNTNCFGPCDPHKDHIVPATILSILRGESPIIKSDGVTMKSYLHVQDVVDAYLLIAEAVVNGQLHGEAINVSGGSMSVQNLVKLIRRAAQSTLPVTVLGQPNDQRNEFLDTTHIKALGWKPKYTVEQALAETYKWFEAEYARKPVGTPA